MRYVIQSCRDGRFPYILARCLPSLMFTVLLAACGSGNDSAVIPGPNPSPTPTPTPIAANTVVAYSSETAELKLYAGQSRQMTLSFRTSDGGSASELALAMPASGLPVGWRVDSQRTRCEQVDADKLCQIALTYAPAAAEPAAVVTFPYSYRNNKGDAGTGTIAIAFRALAVNAATTALLPAGPVKGVVGKTNTVLLGFGTNDNSPATDLHIDTDLAALPAGWTSPAAKFDCPNFGGKSVCMMALSYAPASAAPAALLAIGYRYRDSSGKQQTATASIDYSATAPNTVDVSLVPAGVVRARAGTSQQVTLTFAPSDGIAASKLILTTDTLPTGWTVKASTLPCAKVDGSGGCALTLLYTPGADQPAGKMTIEYAYTDAAGRELAGTTEISYSSHDYRVYVTDYGAFEGSKALGGGVRQCELTSDGMLNACAKVDTAWPVFGVSEIVIHGARAYVGAVTGTFGEVLVPDRQVTVCNIAAYNALTDCTGAGLLFNQLVGLAVSRLGAFVVAVHNNLGNFDLTYCKAANDGYPDLETCVMVKDDSFMIPMPVNAVSTGQSGCNQADVPPCGGIPIDPYMYPYAVTSTDSKVYIATTDRKRQYNQGIFSCSVDQVSLNCKRLMWGIPEGQLIERMSPGQAGGKSYLYLATSALLMPEKNGGRIVKCVAGDDGVVDGCGKGTVPKGLEDADLKRIRDLRIVGDTAWLVTGHDALSAAVYKCPVNQQTGDIEYCDSAGNVEGAVRNFGIAVR